MGRGISGPTTPPPGVPPALSPTATGMGLLRTPVELGKRMGTYLLVPEEGGCGRPGETPIEWWFQSRSGKGRAHLSLSWAPVSVTLARASGPERILLWIFWSSCTPHPALDHDGCLLKLCPLPPAGSAGRVWDGLVPLNSHLSLPRAAVPAGLCPQFQPLAMCPPRAVPPACDPELSRACGPWGPHY